MSVPDPTDELWDGTAGGVPSRIARTVGAMRVDLAWLHATWMGLVFAPGPGDNSIEHRRPRSTRGAVGYRLWAVVGAPVVAAVYPLYVLGLATRFYARRIDRATASLGFVGVALVSALAWGLLAAATYLSPIASAGLVAVVVAGVVATASAVTSLYVARRAGRVATVALGYPLGVTGIFLPPVVAALYSPTLAGIVFPNSELLAIWILDNVLDVGGLAGFIRARFDLQGLAYVGMWFGLAIPTGWFLGALVALANAVRPSVGPDAVEDVDPGFVYR